MTFHLSNLRYFFVLFACANLFFISACYNNPDSSDIDTLIVGVLPDQNKEALLSQYQPLVEYISNITGLNFQLFIPNSYDELLSWFHTGKINMALFGGYTFIKAFHLDGAVPVAMRDIDGKFTSVVIVNKKHDVLALEDIEGMSFSFGSPLSTSGHLMPRHFFNEMDIEPERFFSEFIYSGAHDKTAKLVRDGIVDAGVANASIIKNMFQDGRLKSSDVHIIWESGPYPDYVWAISNKFNEEARINILNAFLTLNPQSSSHKDILDRINATHFIPAHKVEFNPLEQIIDTLENAKHL
jgi:phosphonate transport system substrate-binding protein